MAGGRMPGLMVRSRCAKTGELLAGARLAVIDSAGEVSRAFDAERGYFGATYVDDSGAVRDTPHGEYRVVVLDPGRYPDSDGAAPDHTAPEPVPFAFDAASCGYVDAMCPPLPGARAASGGQPAGPAAKAAVDRKGRVYAAYIGLSVLAALFCALYVAPLAYMAVCGTWLSLDASLGGPAFGARLLGWFLSSGFLGMPAQAVPAVLEALGPRPETVAPVVLAVPAAVAAWALAYGKLGMLLEDRTLAKSELLDSLPKAADSTVKGSGGLVRSLARIRDELPTYDPGSGKPPASSGVFVGFVDRPMPEAAPGKAVEAVELLRWAREDCKVEKENESRSLFDKLPAPPRPETPPTMSYVYLPEFLNTMLLGDTRAGKTRRILLATIDLMTRTGESMLIIDPKGELFALTHEFVEQRYGRGNVGKLNFRDPENSDRHNFMQPIIDASGAGRGGTFRRDAAGRVLGDYAKISSAANDLVKMLLPETLDVGNSKYFNQGARSIISSVAIAVASNQLGCPEGEKSLATVAMMIDRYVTPMPDPSAKKADAKWCPYKRMLEALFPHDHPARSAFSTAAAANDKELSQFCTTALTVLQDFRDQAIAKMTSTTDMPPERLGRVPSVIYLIIPHEKATYGALASLYLQQAYAALIDESVRAGRGGRLPVEVTFLCEELGQIPPIPALDSKLTVSLGAGVRWILVFQSLSQLVDKYEEAPANTIWGNCDYKILLKTTDTRCTGEWVRAQLGKYTVESESKSKSKGFFSIIPSSIGASASLSERDVLMPEEIAQWSADIGALVMMSKGKGPYVVPLPDVSQTPTGDLIGINDPAHVAELYSAAYQVRGGEFEEAMGWDPCFGQMEPGRAYTEAEFAAAEREYLDDLRRRALGPAGEKSTIERRSRLVCFLNRRTGEATGVEELPAQGADERLAELAESHPAADGWEELGLQVSRDGSRTYRTREQVEQIVKQKRASIAAKRERKEAAAAERAAADAEADGKKEADRAKREPRAHAGEKPGKPAQPPKGDVAAPAAGAVPDAGMNVREKPAKHAKKPAQALKM